MDHSGRTGLHTHRLGTLSLGLDRTESRCAARWTITASVPSIVLATRSCQLENQVTTVTLARATTGTCLVERPRRILHFPHNAFGAITGSATGERTSAHSAAASGTTAACVKTAGIQRQRKDCKDDDFQIHRFQLPIPDHRVPLAVHVTHTLQGAVTLVRGVKCQVSSVKCHSFQSGAGVDELAVPWNRNHR